MADLASDSKKWHSYYSRDETPPWDSGAPCSHLVRALEGGEVGVDGADEKWAIELGCGRGASAAHLAASGYVTVGVDLVQAALEAAATRAAGLGLEVVCHGFTAPRAAAPGAAPKKAGAATLHLVQANLLDGFLDALAAHGLPGRGGYDVVFDLQVFHALWRRTEGGEIIPALEAALMRPVPTSRILVITGNISGGKRAGPAMLTAVELLGAYEGVAPLDADDESNKLRCESLRSCRFDPTPMYVEREGEEGILAWAAIFYIGRATDRV